MFGVTRKFFATMKSLLCDRAVRFLKEREKSIERWDEEKRDGSAEYSERGERERAVQKISCTGLYGRNDSSLCEILL